MTTQPVDQQALIELLTRQRDAAETRLAQIAALLGPDHIGGNR